MFNMLPETVNCNIRYSSYWERPYTQWKVSSWDDFYLEKYPNASKRKSHDSLGSELDALIKNLKPKTKHHNKVLLLKRNLEVSIFMFLEINEHSNCATPYPLA